jgi:hypothetical protein
MKKFDAQKPCHFPLLLPVSMFAVLPISNIDPINPKIIEISGWYLAILNAFSRAIERR